MSYLDRRPQDVALLAAAPVPPFCTLLLLSDRGSHCDDRGPLRVLITLNDRQNRLDDSGSERAAGRSDLDVVFRVGVEITKSLRWSQVGA